MKFWKSIVRFFKSFRAQAKPNQTTVGQRIVTEPDFSFIPVFFFVVGHTPRDKGARNEIHGEYEFDFSFEVGAFFLGWLDSYCSKIPVFKLVQPVGTYRHRVRSIKNKIKKITGGMYSFGLNSHFNAGGGEGNENLIAKGSRENFDNYFADQLSNVLESCLGIPQRRNHGVWEITEKHNGGGMIFGMGEVDCTTTIVEPTWKRDFPESRKIFDHKNRYAKILAETVVICYLNRGLIKKVDIKIMLKYWDITGDLPQPRRFINE